MIDQNGKFANLNQSPESNSNTRDGNDPDDSTGDYYYDDATGYEPYDDEDDDEEENSRSDG